jgi:hypothetical protein
MQMVSGRLEHSQTGATLNIYSNVMSCDENGILYGVNASDDSLCIVDIFTTKIYTKCQS